MPVIVAITVALGALSGCNGDDASSKDAVGKSPAVTTTGGASTPSAKATTSVTKAPKSSPSYAMPLQRILLRGTLSLPAMKGWEKSPQSTPSMAMYIDRATCPNSPDDCPFFSALPAPTAGSLAPTMDREVAFFLSCNVNDASTYARPMKPTGTKLVDGVAMTYYRKDMMRDCPAKYAVNDAVGYVWRVGNFAIFAGDHVGARGSFDLKKFEWALGHAKWVKRP
jgi:hypothetical protein